MLGIKSHKNKLIVVLLVGILFFPISYKLAFSKTFAARRELRQMNTKLANMEDAPGQIIEVKRKLKSLSNIIDSDSVAGGLQNKVLNEISDICTKNGLLLKEMPPMYKNIDNVYCIETINVQVSGSFHKLLKLLFQIESPEKNFNIVSTSFYTIENKQKKQKQLVLSLYIQTIKQESHEDLE